MKTLITVVFGSLLIGCLAPPVGVARTNNEAIDVELLFTHDGCKVFRFRDNSYHYFVKCDGAQSAKTIQRVSCGRNCTRAEEIPTLTVNP